MDGAARVLIIVVPIVVGAAGGGLLVYYTRFRRPFRGPGVTVPAVITGIRQATFSVAGRPPYFARVDFTPPGGRPITTEIRLIPAPLGPMIEPFGAYARVGMRVWVNFDPANPLRAEINPEASRPPGRAPKRRPQLLAFSLIAGVALIIVVVLVVVVVTFQG